MGSDQHQACHYPLGNRKALGNKVATLFLLPLWHNEPYPSTHKPEPGCSVTGARETLNKNMGQRHVAPGGQGARVKPIQGPYSLVAVGRYRCGWGPPPNYATSSLPPANLTRHQTPPDPLLCALLEASGGAVVIPDAATLPPPLPLYVFISPVFISSSIRRCFGKSSTVCTCTCGSKFAGTYRRWGCSSASGRPSKGGGTCSPPPRWTLAPWNWSAGAR